MPLDGRNAVVALAALSRYQESEEDDGCDLGRLPEDVLRLVRHWVVFGTLGFEGCCRYGCLEVLEYVCQSGLVRPPKRQAMQKCLWVGYGHLNIVQYLIGDLHASLHEPQGLAVERAAELGSEEVVQYLVEDLGARWTNDERLMLAACTGGSVGVVRYLVELGLMVDPDKCFTHTCDHGHLALAGYWADEWAANIHVDDESALRWACDSGHLDIVQYLVDEYDADVTALNNQSIRHASENGHIEVVKYLVAKGANVRSDYDSALRAASSGGHLSVVKFLLECGSCVHSGFDAALRGACEGGHLPVVQHLIESGADINADDPDTGENRPLAVAAEYGHISIVQCLVEAGADVHADGDNAITCAVDSGFVDIVQFLMDGNGDIDFDEETDESESD